MPSQHSDTVSRLDVFTGIPYNDFANAFDETAPAFNPGPMERITETRDSWDDVRALMAAMAPNDLVQFARINGTSLFSTAGHTTRFVGLLDRQSRHHRDPVRP